MPSWVITLAVGTLLEILKDKKMIQKTLPALAKIYVAMDHVKTLVPDLAAAIERKKLEEDSK